MSKPVIISGEASETDSENDADDKVNIMTKSVQGAIVTGEDSESENENEASIASALSALNFNPESTMETPEEENTYDSLFHQKLRDCNIQLYNNIESTYQNVISQASRNLNNIEQQLLRSQLTMQNAVMSLKTLSVNSLMIKSKLHSLLSSDFLSNVTVKKL
ncbi:unnamed protein product [Phaedon cochleariae]|uniref:Biogenesis of lysosome-related organelles complex 1 subunit 3 n=1 Tax=Phaedon cochleariae TaxID=80249 RepID=A0A9N9SIX8_PHACE|nr:unnamed protein product [Phaedon cochleariae]